MSIAAANTQNDLVHRKLIGVRLTEDHARLSGEEAHAVRSEFRSRLEMIQRQRALKRTGVRVSGFDSLQRYKTRDLSFSEFRDGPANDNPKLPFRLSINPAAAVSLVAVSALLLILFFGR